MFSFEYCFLFGLDWFGLFVFLVLASCLFVLTGCGALFCFFVVADVFVADVRWQQKSLQVPPHWRPFFPPFVRAPTVLRPPLEMWLAWVQPSKVRGYQSGGAGVPRTLS